MKGKKNAQATTAYSGYTFLNVPLARDDKAWLSIRANTDQFGMELVTALCSEGYKVSLSPNDKGGGHLATLTDVREDSPHYKYILTGRGSTANDAWCSLCYRHFILGESDWSILREMANDSDSRFG